MRWLGDEEDVWGFIFAAAKIVLIVVLAAGYCDTSSQVNALEARVKDLSARLEAHASEGRNILVSGKVELVHGRPGAHDKGCDAEVDSYSAFFDNAHLHDTGLDAHLRAQGIDELYVCGLATDYCVKHTVLDALALGYRVTLMVDGCRAVDASPGDGARAIAEMEAAGCVVRQGSTI